MDPNGAIEIVYPNDDDDNNNYNNNNNNIIIRERKNNHQKEGRRASGEGERVRERENFFFSSLPFFLRSTKIGPQVFVGAEGKVDLRDESYAWTPKSWSFDKLYEVGVLSYLKLHFV